MSFEDAILHYCYEYRENSKAVSAEVILKLNEFKELYVDAQAHIPQHLETIKTRLKLSLNARYGKNTGEVHYSPIEIMVSTGNIAVLNNLLFFCKNEIIDFSNIGPYFLRNTLLLKAKTSGDLDWDSFLSYLMPSQNWVQRLEEIMLEANTTILGTKSMLTEADIFPLVCKITKTEEINARQKCSRYAEPLSLLKISLDKKLTGIAVVLINNNATIILEDFNALTIAIKNALWPVVDAIKNKIDPKAFAKIVFNFYIKEAPIHQQTAQTLRPGHDLTNAANQSITAAKNALIALDKDSSNVTTIVNNFYIVSNAQYAQEGSLLHEIAKYVFKFHSKNEVYSNYKITMNA